MSYRYELVRISNTHNAIADWLIANPGKGQMGRCATVFNVTRSWLSTLTHTDAFQALLKNKQDGTFEAVVIPLYDKLVGVAHRGVEVLGELLDDSTDPKLKHAIAKDALAMCGYGAGASTIIDNSVQNNQFNVNGEALAKAKLLRDARFNPTAEGTLIESKSEPTTELPAQVKASQELALSDEFTMGETRDTRSELINSPKELNGISKEGDNL